MRLIGEKRQGDITVGLKGGFPTYNETWYYIVEADSKFQTRNDIANFSELPQVGFDTSTSGFSICTTKSCTRRPDNPIIWDVVVTYSSDVEEGSNQADLPESTPLPEAWIPRRRTMAERKEDIFFFDHAGNAVANSAGQPYETGIPRARYIPVWEFGQFELPTVTDETILARNEIVNASTYKGIYAAKTLLLTVVDSILGTYYGRPLRFTVYRLKYDKYDWRQKRLDVGTVYKDGTAYKPYLDASGNVMLGALNGSGGKAAVGTAPSIRYFEQYATGSFDFLRI